LEIGTARGGTLFFLTRLASPHATIVSVDLPGGPFGGGYPRRRALLSNTSRAATRWFSSFVGILTAARC
jgi:hypothetical protein